MDPPNTTGPASKEQLEELQRLLIRDLYTKMTDPNYPKTSALLQVTRQLLKDMGIDVNSSRDATWTLQALLHPIPSNIDTPFEQETDEDD